MKVSQDILNLVPYAPGKPIEETKRELGLSEVHKLASNENPLGPSPLALAAIRKALPDLHRYPDSNSFELKTAVARYYGVPQNRITFGNGSNEIIDFLIRIYCQPGDAILTSQGAFIAYKISAQAASVKTIETPLTSEMKFDVQAMVQALRTHSQIRLVFLANPNNPTGTYINEQETQVLLSELQNHPDVMLVVDEAYLEFVRAKDYVRGDKILAQFPRTAVLRTFSKIFGLAGLRLGTLIAPPEVIDLVNRVRNPFNINSLAQVAAVAAVDDVYHLTCTQVATWEGLDYFYGELQEMGLKFWPSQGNFVLFDTPKDSKVVFDQLLKEGVIMRPLQNYGFKTLMRLSVGTRLENELAIRALKKVLAKI